MSNKRNEFIENKIFSKKIISNLLEISQKDKKLNQFEDL